MNLAVIAAAALAVAGAPKTESDQAAALVKAAVGPWSLTEVGGKIECTLTFTDQQAAGGRDLTTPPACQRAFPPLRDLTVWSLDLHGAPVLSDRGRAHVVTFAGPTGGPYDATAPDGKAWRLAALTPRLTVPPPAAPAAHKPG
jgi:hypothetical protein